MHTQLRAACRALLAACLASTGLAVAAAASEDDAMNRVSFQVERSREVANDWLRATVSVTAESPDPAALADEINRTMSWALEIARGRQGVQVESGGYHTQPIHEKGRLARWRGTQELRLEGGAFEAVTALLGELQSRLQLGSLQFSVSPERRRSVEDELIAEALDAFRGRAAIVQDKLGAEAYRIVRLDVSSQGPSPRPVFRDTMMRTAAAEVAPPAVEGGSSLVSVGVSAVIELD